MAERNLESTEKNSADIAEVNARLAAVEKKQRETETHTTDAAKSAEDAVLKEMEEREAKKSNIFVHNLKEPGDEIVDVDERKQEDLALLKAMLDITTIRVNLKEDVKFTTRLGARKSDDLLFYIHLSEYI